MILQRGWVAVCCVVVVVVLGLLAAAAAGDETATVATAETCEESAAVGLWSAATAPAPSAQQHKMPLVLTPAAAAAASVAAPRWLALFHAGPESEAVVRLTLRCSSPSSSSSAQVTCGIRVLAACPTQSAPESSVVVGENTTTGAAAAAEASVALGLWRYGSVVVALLAPSAQLRVDLLATSDSAPAVPGDACGTSVAIGNSSEGFFGDTSLARRSAVCGAVPKQGLWLRLPPPQRNVSAESLVVVHTCAAGEDGGWWPAMDVQVFDDEKCSSCPKSTTHVRRVACGGRGGTAATWTPEVGVGHLLFVSGMSAFASGRFRLSISRDGSIPENVFCSHAVHADASLLLESLDSSSAASSASARALPLAFEGDEGAMAGDLPASGGSCSGDAAGLWFSVGFASDGRRVRAGLECRGPSPSTAAVDVYVGCSSKSLPFGCVRTTPVESSSGSSSSSSSSSPFSSVVEWYAPNASLAGSPSKYYLFVRGCDGAFTLWFDADNATSSGELDFVSSDAPATDSDAVRSSSFSGNAESSSHSPWFFLNWSWIALFGALAGAIAVFGGIFACIAMCIAWRRARREQARDLQLAGLTSVFEEDDEDDENESGFETARFVRMRRTTPTVNAAIV